MPLPALPLKRRDNPPRESFLLKSMLVVSALFFGSLVMANMEFYVSSPNQSLSQVEVALRVAAR